MQLAQHYGVPVINADSRQIYRELKIGTAAPTDEQLRQVPHLFVGTQSIDDYYNASMYEQEVLEGLEALCEELKQLDPEHYAIVDRQNYRRVIHALEICHQTGKTYTSFRTQQKKERPFRIIKIGLNRDREELYNRINQRVDQMMEDGLLDEVKGLVDKRQTNALNTVGYKELFDYLDGRWPLDEAVERIKGNTRRYARKQLTWFKRDENMRWFHPDDIQDILNYITHYE